MGQKAVSLANEYIDQYEAVKNGRERPFAAEARSVLSELLVEAGNKAKSPLKESFYELACGNDRKIVNHIHRISDEIDKASKKMREEDPWYEGGAEILDMFGYMGEYCRRIKNNKEYREFIQTQDDLDIFAEMAGYQPGELKRLPEK
jgi:hypothetical protein